MASDNTSRVRCTYGNCSITFVNTRAMRKHQEEYHKPAKECPYDCIPTYSTKRRTRLVQHFVNAHGIYETDAFKLGQSIEDATPYDLDIPAQDSWNNSSLEYSRHPTYLVSSTSHNIDIPHPVRRRSLEIRSNDVEDTLEELPKHSQKKESIELKINPPHFHSPTSDTTPNIRLPQSASPAPTHTATLQTTDIPTFKEPSEADWERSRPLIQQLYVDEGKILEEVIDIMLQHGHIASSKAYRSWMRTWEFDKKLKKRDATISVTENKPLNQDHQLSEFITQASKPKEAATFRDTSVSHIDTSLEGQIAPAAHSEMPFTDSGYNSAPILGQSRHPELDFKSKSCSISDYSPPTPKNDEDDAKTLFSMDTVVKPQNAYNFIADLRNDICGKLNRFHEFENESIPWAVLPELIKAFAVKICHDEATQVNREIMYFLYKSHGELISQLEMMAKLNEEDEQTLRPESGGGMSYTEKVRVWMMNDNQDPPHIPRELFLNIKDYDEDFIDQNKISEYHRIVLDSEAYKWFLSALRRESTQQSEKSQLRIGQEILSQLPTGTISKRRSPAIHEFTFDIEGLPVQQPLDKRILDIVVITGSLTEMQRLTVAEYLAQVWPTIGLQALNALQMAIINVDKYCDVYLPENTQIEIKIVASRVIVKATGQAYFVAMCGELMAWIGSALLCSTQEYNGRCTPSITCFQVNFTPLQSAPLKFESSCSIKLDVMSVGSSDYSPLRIQNPIQSFLGEHVLISRFPILWRPEGFSGLELRFESLMNLLRADKVHLTRGLLSIQTTTRQSLTLKLAKHTNDVFLWHFFYPFLKSHLSLASDLLMAHDDKLCNLYTLRDLEGQRHIIANYPEDLTDIPGTLTSTEIASRNRESKSVEMLTSSTEDSSDSTIPSMSESSDYVKPLDPDEEIYPTLCVLLSQLLSGFQNAAQYESSPGDGSGGSGALTNTIESHTGETSRNSLKRIRKQINKDDSDEEGCYPPPKKTQLRRDMASPKLFACPFFKKDMFKHSWCGGRKLRRIKDITQHLTRKHTPENYCLKCLETGFPDKASLQKHIRKGKCIDRDPSTLDGVSYEQDQQLHPKNGGKSSRKNAPKLSEVDQWFKIWDILFPGRVRPSSVYLDDCIIREVHPFYDYCNDTSGQAEMREFTRTNSSVLNLKTNTERLEEHIPRIISEAINHLVLAYCASISSGSDHRGISIAETPASLSENIGLGLEGQLPLRNVGSQNTQLPQTFSVEESGPTSQLTAVDSQSQSHFRVESDATLPTQFYTESYLPENFGPLMGSQEVEWEGLSHNPGIFYSANDIDPDLHNEYGNMLGGFY